MGLGLYISREIIELHGGSLNLDSTVESGTRFVISLPVAQTQPLDLAADKK
jgi:signal transduction histidine kinase